MSLGASFERGCDCLNLRGRNELIKLYSNAFALKMHKASSLISRLTSRSKVQQKNV